MQRFKATKLIVALGATLTLLSACDSKTEKEVEPVEPTTQESALDESNGAVMPAEAEPVAEPVAATSFNPSEYYDLSQADGAETIRKLYLKMAASQLNDVDFAMAHNIEGAYSSNAFEQKAAAEKTAEFKAKSLAYDVPKNGKLVVAMLPGNLFTQLRSEESITSIGTDGLKLLEYDFDKKAFPYTYTYNQSCLNTQQVYNNIPSEVNLIKTGLGGFSADGIDIKVADENEMEKTCYLPVADEAVASQIEDARVAGKIAFTGKAYLTAKDIMWADRGSYGVTTTINADIDAEELYLHIVQPDGSLSSPLATQTFVFSKTS